MTERDITLVETKLHAPRRRRGVVERGRLTTRTVGRDRPALTLVSAPAGFGKTTLLTDLFVGEEAKDQALAWLSLDAGDNDPRRFWSYVIAAIQTAAPEAGETASAMLRSDKSGLEPVVATLVNDLDVLPMNLVLVLDDYHVIDTAEIHETVAFLLEHVPPQVHLAMASRSDPPLPLARLRARGELLEIRAADLRFTIDEASAYFRDSMGLDLAEDDVRALESRTEGWIAALQLAALSLQGRDDVATFIANFTGDDRFVVDYLAEEVLERQPDDVRDFLLQTSILGRLTASLCDAVTGSTSSKAMLESLERANLFVVPLDDHRRWYRYHHLFGDVLQAHLLNERPDAVTALHGRASTWYEDNGDPSEAIAHAVAANDFERAADLAETVMPLLFRTRQEATIRAWMELIPEDVVRTRPVLAVEFAGALLVAGQFAGVEERLCDAERWLDPTAPHGSEAMVVVDDSQFRFLPGQIETYRSALALVRGDLAGALEHTRRVLEIAPEEDQLSRASAAGVAGLALWAGGDLDGGYQAYADCVDGLREIGNLADIAGCTIALADIRMAQGRLGDAVRLYEHTLQLFDE
ncbi:MAG: helix-turn-helix transcriptional regulator, partial [Actinobacteria bacterium]|nr:helix-turn-helix transcriptional regulator [Actinomycetota bacterium]